MKSVIKVMLVEYERGWGSRIDDIVYFKDVNNAQTFVNEFNSKNTDKVAPDWYMVAEGPKISQIDDALYATINFRDDDANQQTG